MSASDRRVHLVIRSAKATHFTTELAQNAGEDENLAHPSYAGFSGGNVVVPENIKKAHSYIRELRMWSDQNLAWEVQFYSKDTFDDTDEDVDTFLGSHSFAVSDGAQVAGTGLYRYSQTKLELFYHDDDASGEIHVKIVNRSATTKTAGAPGSLVLEIAAEPLH